MLEVLPRAVEGKRDAILPTVSAEERARPPGAPQLPEEAGSLPGGTTCHRPPAPLWGQARATGLRCARQGYAVLRRVVGPGPAAGCAPALLAKALVLLGCSLARPASRGTE